MIDATQATVPRVPPDRARAGLGRWIEALIAGEAAAAAACLAPDFGRHSGRDAAGFLAHELAEFARRRAPTGLARGWRLELTDHDAGGQGFFVRDAAGALVYEDRLSLDAAGRIRGDGSAFELISKLAITSEGTFRALALRCPGGTVRAAVPRGTIATDLRLAKGMSWAEDGFWHLSFRLPGDDLKGRDLRLRLLGDGHGETRHIRLRGVDHPCFRAALTPELDGRRVTLPETDSVPWALTVSLVDGRRESHAHPAPGTTLTFPAPVVRAVLTDALDNDWVAP